jgi:hypothetical protein
MENINKFGRNSGPFEDKKYDPLVYVERPKEPMTNLGQDSYNSAYNANQGLLNTNLHHSG